jgi:hydrogenase expression/formation protein HypD
MTTEDRELKTSEKVGLLSRKVREGCAKLGTVTLMEVCGTHTMAIHRHGIHSLLPQNLRLISGPGCPVCVMPTQFMDEAIELARRPDVIVTTFGDLMRVPGSDSTLDAERASGANVRLVYSALDSLTVAEERPGSQVVFLAVGFETTAPTVAATVLEARRRGVANFAILPGNRLVPPALRALLDDEDVRVDGFILPGHVSVIIGSEAYRFVATEYNVPSAIAGFDPEDIMVAISCLVEMLATGQAEVANCYRRVVRADGNIKARQAMDDVFETSDGGWRGLGDMPGSALVPREKYKDYDARARFDLSEVRAAPDPPGCLCGSVLRGIVTPPECPLFAKRCVPESPIGPCMVSSEGTCAAYYKYRQRDDA